MKRIPGTVPVCFPAFLAHLRRIRVVAGGAPPPADGHQVMSAGGAVADRADLARRKTGRAELFGVSLIFVTDMAVGNCHRKIFEPSQ